VAKITGKEGARFTGRARMFDSEEASLQKILDGTVQKAMLWLFVPAPRVTIGALAKFAKLTCSASEGAVTDKYL
jgi:dihydroxyacid dehydratase/phosphogluconate dehydratase